MESLVNYSSEDEHDESGQPHALRNSFRLNATEVQAAVGPIVDAMLQEMTMGATVRIGAMATLVVAEVRAAIQAESFCGRKFYFLQDSYNRHKAANRSSSSYYGRDGRDVRDSKYTKDNRYDYKVNERNRTKDYKTDYKRERERDNYHDNRRTPRDDMDRGRHSTGGYSSNYHRYSAANARDERPSRYSGGNDSFTSSSAGPHRHHAYQSVSHQHHPYQQSYHSRSYDERMQHEQRSNRPAGERQRRRADSRSPSPSTAPSPHHYHKRSARLELKTHHPRHRSRSKSRSPASRTPTPTQERIGTNTAPQPQPLMQARISALEMERNMQDGDFTEEYKSIPSKESAAAVSLKASEALLALPLNETAPKQPNVIAVAPPIANSAASNSEPSVIQLPTYYNPSVINPNKYAEQVQKRKLLWGAKKAEDTAAKWGNAQFSQDSDGKVASKFMRLMGIKNAAPTKSESENGASAKPVGAAPDIKSREVMFSNMEQQYEVARQTTHTMRGVGLGFSSQSRPF